MKKFILALVAMVTMTFTTASAMSYEQARQQALFLTDKMAYELNLTDDQYEAAYETNLDYLMSVNTVDDLYGIYWRQRNMDLSYILLDWQYRTFINASYFYRPLYWDAGYWHFGIYARYPHRDYFYFGRPHFYVSYRGGHSWRMNGGRSWYHGRDFGGPRPEGHPRVGMRDGFNRGDFGRGQSFGNMSRGNGQSFGNMNRNNDYRPQSVNRPQNNGGFGNQSSSFGNQNRQFGNRQSSTRTTVTRENPSNNSRPGGSFGGNRGGSFGSGSTMMRSFGSGNTTSPSRSFTPRSNPGNGGASFGNSSRSFGGGNRSVGGPTRSYGGGSHGSFGGRR
ncbi:hypothetical protein KUA50_002990 [Segatella hominis]|uniref:hypothetical protein n=1 Tax=Segatella hominis TaxID=2518605 RepID=UPI001C47A3A4|nr:hypothetical protein [Segatella hominis]WOZ81947.1 hypothetical protein KUA50_002990 [Segatella hominis]